MNLPNAMSIGRIVATPLIALLPFIDNWQIRLIAWVLYIAAAVTDYYDGVIARTRNLITDLGKQLDPLADKLLLVGTLIPMYMLVGSAGSFSILSPHTRPLVDGVLGPMIREGATRGEAFPLITPFGLIGLPWWIIVVVLGREFFMSVFRSAAARRGVVIAAIGPAKWKTGFQMTWVGAVYFWFWAATAAAHFQLRTSWWNAFAHFNGIVGVLSMLGAVALTLYSLWLYLRRYSYVFRGARQAA
jgi:CDP-diacylglycerol---glycerol-3-phosphate 3-phosphatidyltransferase